MGGMKTLVAGIMMACFCGTATLVAQTPTHPPAQEASNASGEASQGIRIYSYEDDKGVVHFVDSLDLVPGPYRARAAERAASGAMVGDGQGTVNVIAAPAGAGPGAASDVASPDEPATSSQTVPVGTSAQSSPGAGTVGDTGAGEPQKLEGRAYWQARIAEWQQRKAAAESELRAVDTEILRTRTLTPAGFQKTLGELQERRKSLEQEIQLAEDMLANVIPEEARKAGVPPGWLR